MIPKINGTQTLTAGVFSLKEKICLCHGRKELFAVLENRLKTVPTLENTIFHFSSEDKVSSAKPTIPQQRLLSSPLSKILPSPRRPTALRFLRNRQSLPLPAIPATSRG